MKLLSETNIVVMGDSITWGAYTDDKIWWQELGNRLGCRTITGNGVCGSCFSKTSDYYMQNAPMSERWKNLPSGADVYIIFGGTNDYGHGSKLGSINDVKDESFYGAMHQIIIGLQERNPNAKLVFITPLRRYGFGTKMDGTHLLYDSMENSIGHSLADYREAIIKKCASHDISVIDAYQFSEFDFSEGQDGVHPFNENAEGKNLLTTDGLHPNTEGHIKFAENVFPYMKEILGNL